MPSLPSSTCVEPGCPNPTRLNAKRCADHGGHRGHGSASSRGYGQAWRLVRLAQLSTHPTCYLCGAPATDVDHISPRRVETAAGRNPDQPNNLRSMCHRHHSAKTWAEGQ